MSSALPLYMSTVVTESSFSGSYYSLSSPSSRASIMNLCRGKQCCRTGWQISSCGKVSWSANPSQCPKWRKQSVVGCARILRLCLRSSHSALVATQTRPNPPLSFGFCSSANFDLSGQPLKRKVDDRLLIFFTI